MNEIVDKTPLKKYILATIILPIEINPDGTAEPLKDYIQMEFSNCNELPPKQDTTLYHDFLKNQFDSMFSIRGVYAKQEDEVTDKVEGGVDEAKRLNSVSPEGGSSLKYSRGCNVAEKGRSEVTDPEYETSVKYSNNEGADSNINRFNTTFRNKRIFSKNFTAKSRL